jgi:hypothetical protein
MRAAVNGQAAGDLTENAAGQQEAVREAAKAEAALASVERDYLDGGCRSRSGSALRHGS